MMASGAGFGCNSNIRAWRSNKEIPV
jgi:hypothetical protein